MMKNINQIIRPIIHILIVVIVFSCDKSDSNSSPEIPNSPSPQDMSENLDIALTLSWNCTDIDGDKLSYDIYLGTTENPAKLDSGILSQKYSPPKLNYDTTYFWKIVSTDEHGQTTEGPLWSFKTKGEDCGEIKNMYPPDNSKYIETSITLSWDCTDPDNDKLNFDIYLGTSSTPQLVATDNSDNYFNLSNLEFETTYYWKIIAKDGSGNQSVSDVFKFTTGKNITTQDFQLGNSGIFVTMIWIESGEFMMGAQNGETDAMGDEFPRHKVTISEGFWLGKYEITQAQWEAIVGSWDFYFNGNPERPAENVSWNHIHSLFLDELNNYETDNVWRLPSEAEWEYACRAGYDATRFWWGNDENYELIDNYAWCWQNNSHRTQDVGQKLPNPWGLYDMNGNVWEWCEDQYHNSYVGAPTNGSIWGTSDTNGKVARGGGWGEYGAPFCRSSARGRDNPAYGYKIFGFRLVREEN